MKLRIFLTLVLATFFQVGFSQQIDFEWKELLGSTDHSSGNEVQCDSAGYIYAAGTFGVSSTAFGLTMNAGMGRDGYLLKLDSTGNLIWHKQFKSHRDVNITAIQVDRNNDLLVVGDYKVRVDFDVSLQTNNADTFLSSNMFICKYDGSGNLLWAKNTGGVAYEGNSVAVDGNDNLLLAGESVDISLFDTVGTVYTLDSTFYPSPFPHWSYFHTTNKFIAKYDAFGVKMWIRETDGNPREMMADHNNHIVVSGGFWAGTTFDGVTVVPTGTESAYLAKYDAAGQLVWVRLSGGSSNENGAFGLAIDAANNLYQSGKVSGNNIRFGGNIVSTFASTDAFLSKYDPNGNLTWYRMFGTPDPHQNYNCGNALAMDPLGDILLIGYFMDTLTFGNTTIACDGAPDVMLLKLDQNGNVQKAAEYVDYGWVTGNDVTVDQNNNIYITGLTFLNDWNSGSPSFAFVGKVNSRIVGVQNGSFPGQIKVSPNPFHSAIALEFSEQQTDTKIEISDCLGKTIKSERVAGTRFIIENEAWQAGVYFLKITDDHQRVYNTKIVSQ